MNKVFVFDLDHTLFKTTAVDRPDLPEVYAEFRDPDKLVTESEPMPLLKLVKDLQDEGQPVYILTARCNTVSDAIYSLLAQHGIYGMHVVCVGDKEGVAPIDKRKAHILNRLSSMYSKVYFYDDTLANLRAAPDHIRKYTPDNPKIRWIG